MTPALPQTASNGGLRGGFESRHLRLIRLMEKHAIIEFFAFFPYTSCLPVCDGLELHGRVLDHGDGAPDVDQTLMI